jgi:thiosulfate/3-mercaptopyruvate sulfurtransferase
MTSKLTRNLVSAQALAASLDDPRLRLVDVRWYLNKPGEGRRAHEAGHLPGAIHLDVDGDLAAPPGGANGGRHPLPDPAVFARRLEAAGIGDRNFVVAYDDVGGWVASRLWWMLDDLGHRDVAVLDGGIAAWTAAGFPLATERDTAPHAGGHLHLRDRWTKVIDRRQLRGRLGSAVLLDARAGPRYRGETEPIDPAAGHIPTARSAPIDGSLEGPGGRFLPPDALAQRFRNLGAEAGADVVTYCGSGVSATHTSLAMRVAGLPDPILYGGSWSEWSTAGEPVATGPEPGAPPGR